MDAHPMYGHRLQVKCSIRMYGVGGWRGSIMGYVCSFHTFQMHIPCQLPTFLWLLIAIRTDVVHQKADKLIPYPPPSLSPHLLDYLVSYNKSLPKSWFGPSFVCSPLPSTCTLLLFVSVVDQIIALLFYFDWLNFSWSANVPTGYVVGRKEGWMGRTPPVVIHSLAIESSSPWSCYYYFHHHHILFIIPLHPFCVHVEQ